MPALHIPPNNLRELYAYCNDLREQKQFCDVVIKVGGRSFHCHRVILASALKYFRKMFSGLYNEVRVEEIELFGVEADDFELLLTYIYGSSVSFGQDDSYRLLRISHYLCVPELENRCIQYMYDHAYTSCITLDTAFNILHLSSAVLKNERLEDKFVTYIAKSFLTAVECPNFIHISGTHLLRILKHPLRTTNSPSITLDFLEKWMQSQPSKYKTELLPDLLKATGAFENPDELFVRAVRLLSNSTFIKCEGESNDEMSGNVALEMNEDQICDHEKMKIPFVLYSLDHDQKTNCHLNLYKFWDSNKVQFWRRVSRSRIFKDSRMKVKFCKSFLIDEIHYVLISEMHSADDNFRNPGAYYYKPYISQGFRFSHVKEWAAYDNSVAHAPGGFDFPITATTAAVGTNIYVYDQFCFVVLNCQTGQWTQMLDDGLVPTKLGNLVSCDSSLYLVGGLDTTLNLSKTSTSNKEKFLDFAQLNGKRFQRFDAREGKWMQMPSLTYARNQSASCVHNGVLYVSGGDDFMYHKRAIECFDFKAGKWFTLKTSMPAPKMNHISLAHDNQLWFFGGRKYELSQTNLRPDMSWYSYNLVEHTWSKTFLISPFRNDYEMMRILDVVNI